MPLIITKDLAGFCNLIQILTFNSFRIIIVYLEHVAIRGIRCSNYITNVRRVKKCLKERSKKTEYTK